MIHCSDETYQELAKDVIFIDCVFIISPACQASFPKATFNCSFVFQSEPFCILRPSYMSQLCRELPPSHVWWGLIESNIVGQRYLEIMYAQRELAAIGKRQVRYKNQSKMFAASTVVCGVELEIPTNYDGTLDARSWHIETDDSQIRGNLEVVSVPLALSSVLDLQEKITKLYQKVGAPEDEALYVNVSTIRASGIHVHFSWTNPAITCQKLQQTLYWLTDKRGGADYLEKVGGKSSAAFGVYSPYSPNSTRKYNSFHIVSNHRLEMRWMNNSPNPEIAAKRIKIATLLFVEAFMHMELKLYVESLDKSLRFCYH
jgi:hypothetical protein